MIFKKGARITSPVKCVGHFIASVKEAKQIFGNERFWLFISTAVPAEEIWEIEWPSLFLKNLFSSPQYAICPAFFQLLKRQMESENTDNPPPE